MAADGSLGEQVCLALQFPVLIQNFQRTQQEVRTVLVKGHGVATGIDQSVVLGVPVIHGVQLGLLFLDFFFGKVLCLIFQKGANAVPQFDHALDTALGGLGNFHGVHTAVLAVVNFAVHQRVREVTNGGVCGDGQIFLLQIVLPFKGPDFPVDILDGVAQQRLQILIRVWSAGRLRTEGAGHHFHLTQNHVRMVDEIAVHLDAIVIRGEMYPFRLNIHHAVALLEEQNVRCDFRSRSGLEGGVGQTDRAQQFRPLCDVLAGVGGALIHGEAGGDKGDNATGTNLVQRLGDEVFVDGQVQPVIAPVSHFELTKGNIAHGNIKEVVREIHLFKAANGNAVPLVEVTGNPSGNIVQFHAVQFALCHAVRYKAQEVARAAGRLQNVTLGETHSGNGLIHGANHGRWCVEGGQGGLSCCCVLCIGKQAFQLCIPAVVRVKAVCQTAPADIPCKDLLLLFGGRPRMVWIIQLLQSLDGRDVVGIAFAGCSRAECIICDTVVGSPFKQR